MRRVTKGDNRERLAHILCRMMPVANLAYPPHWIDGHDEAKILVSLLLNSI